MAWRLRMSQALRVSRAIFIWHPVERPRLLRQSNRRRGRGPHHPPAIARWLHCSGTDSCNIRLPLWRRCSCAGGRPASRNAYRVLEACCWFATTLAFSTFCFWAFRCIDRSITWLVRLCSCRSWARSSGRWALLPDPAREHRSLGHEGNAAAAQGPAASWLSFPRERAASTESLARSSQGSPHLRPRVGVPVVPAGVAGMFESWPRSRPFPAPRPGPDSLWDTNIASRARRPRYRSHDRS